MIIRLLFPTTLGASATLVAQLLCLPDVEAYSPPLAAELLDAFWNANDVSDVKLRQSFLDLLA